MKELKTEHEIISNWDKQQKNPKVSICCITYNHEDYIDEALKGFLSQETNFSYEILIHDDASTDGTVEIINRYYKKYPKIIKPMYQTENQLSKGGIHPNLDFNYPRAHGDYIALCDGDDYWVDSKKLSKQVEFLDDNKKYIGTAHNVKVIDENGNLVSNKIHPYKKLSTHIFTLKDAEQFQLAGQTSSLVYRNLWKEFDEDILRMYKKCATTGDKKLALLLAINGDVYYFSDTMTNHRKIINHGSSWSAKVSKRNMSLYRYKELMAVKDFAYNAYNISLDNKEKRMEAFYNSITSYLKNPSKKNLNIIYEILNLQYDSKLSLLSSIPRYFVTWPIRAIKRRIIHDK